MMIEFSIIRQRSFGGAFLMPFGGELTAQKTLLMERRLLAVCRGLECAAWRFGRCRIRNK